MSRKSLLSPIPVCLLAALAAPLLCAGAAPQISKERACKHPSHQAASRTCPPRTKATARNRLAESPPPAPNAPVRPGPNHKAWFDDYGVRGAGLIER